VLASCLAHARRKHAELVESFLNEVRFVLETLREVYITDARAREQGLDPAQRLQLHQDESQPSMAALDEWMQAQFAERKIELNSCLDAAILYMQKRWPELTPFLRVPDASLDNNTCERALKKAILHRKHALFYRNLAGAHVGDVFMSLIHSRTESRRLVRLSLRPAAQRRRTRSKPRRLDALELPGDRCTMRAREEADQIAPAVAILGAMSETTTKKQGRFAPPANCVAQRSESASENG